MGDHKRNLGFIGIGAMGSGMTRSLLRAGFGVTAYSRTRAHVDAVAAHGARAAATVAAVLVECDTVLVSLRNSEVFVDVVTEEMLPAARAGQVIVDTGTTDVRETRRLAAAFAARGAALLDAPVSGGEVGADAGKLRIFIGGDEQTAKRLSPVFAALSAPPGRAVYCGAGGAGQLMKYVNQMAMGLLEAAYVETVAFGLRGGLRAEDMLAALEGDDDWRKILAARIRRIAKGEGDDIYVKYPEFPYFLSAADEIAFPAPILRAVHRFLEHAPQGYLDNMNRKRPSFWKELNSRLP